MSGIDLGLGVIGLPVLAASLYLTALAVLARRQAPSASIEPHLKFDIVIPAHNEETGIAATVASLLALDYPREFFRVFVIADNCLDRTAACASDAGAQVIVRDDPEHRGKGYALALAFRRSLMDNFADAVVVVDADTVASANLLRAFSARLEAGALAVQADYGVRNPQSAWRTRLMTIALAAFHGVRSLARERLALSCGLRGNGMGLSRAVLHKVPYNAFSVVEDLEYGLELGYAGVRVQYAHEAKVQGEMVVTERASRSQRRRWEHGRQALVREHVPRLLGQAWRSRDIRLLDLAADLVVPPLGQLVSITLMGAIVSIVAAQFNGGAPIATAVWAASLLGLLLYVLRAWALSGVGLPGLLDLLWAPVYVAWKLTLRFREKRQDPKAWVRTTREVKL
jgi:1,2-diacylglycerol 3-beta-glucosyltransferase